MVKFVLVFSLVGFLLPTRSTSKISLRETKRIPNNGKGGEDGRLNADSKSKTEVRSVSYNPRFIQSSEIMT